MDPGFWLAEQPSHQQVEQKKQWEKSWSLSVWSFWEKDEIAGPIAAPKVKIEICSKQGLHTGMAALRPLLNILPQCPQSTHSCGFEKLLHLDPAVWCILCLMPSNLESRGQGSPSPECLAGQTPSKPVAGAEWHSPEQQANDSISQRRRTTAWREDRIWLMSWEPLPHSPSVCLLLENFCITTPGETKSSLKAFAYLITLCPDYYNVFYCCPQSSSWSWCQLTVLLLRLLSSSVFFFSIFSSFFFIFTFTFKAFSGLSSSSFLFLAEAPLINQQCQSPSFNCCLFKHSLLISALLPFTF